MKIFTVNTDLGEVRANILQGQIPSEHDTDTIFDATKIGEDFQVLGPADLFGERTILAAVKSKAFKGRDYTTIKKVLMDIDITSDLRIAQAGPWDTVELRTRYNLLEGRDYKFKGGNKNAMIRRKKDGTWDTVARGKPIHSVLLGWKRGRFTSQIELDVWTKEHPKEFKILGHMCDIAAKAYKKLAPKEYCAQCRFSGHMINEKYNINDTIFTTLSANKYEEEDTSAMGYHIDAGDLNSSLTCMAVFHEGPFHGANFILPRYRIGIAIGDGDVFVGDSRQQHGVSPLQGAGTRLSCVCYCDTRLAEDSQYRTTEA